MVLVRYLIKILGPNIESDQWNSAMEKRRRMDSVSKSIDIKNKQKYSTLPLDESLKKTISEK